MLTVRAAVTIALSLILSGHSGPSAGNESLDLTSCSVERVSALCGTHRVFENRAAARGRAIDLRVVVLPARSERKAPDPIFFLHGGPGAAASSMAPFLARSPLRERRDIVLVDQRGTGQSHPLDCDRAGFAELLRIMSTFELRDIDRCRERLDADLRMYTTPIAMDDLDDVRRALGFERINLLGGSYGTRAALEYIRRHPGQVRTAILRGVHPPSEVLPLNFDHDSQAALDALLDDCARDRDCARSFPNVREEIAEVLRRLDEAPAEAEVEDPWSGKPVSVTITREVFAGMIHYGLYDSRIAARLPAMIHRGHGGDFAGLIESLAQLATRTGGQLSLGMFLSVVCAEDAPYFDEAGIARESTGTMLGGMMSRGLRRSCEDWPRGALPDDYKQPVRSDVPVLLISGEVDPVTSPRLAERAARHLPNSLHVVLPDTGHAGLAPGCVSDILERFIELGSTEGLETACVARISRPAFLTE
jgi:pimeloyl-ACP methyl ester carboxylesterase